MADVYAKTSIYYDAEWGLRVLRETFDGANATNDTAVNQPCLPSGFQANLYEMRFVPLSGNTANITRNDAPGYVQMGLVRRLDHELRKTPADADGTYNSTVSVRVDIRKISNPVDAVSAVINLTNSVTKQTSVGGPLNPFEYYANYPGQDQDTGTARLQMNYNGRLLQIQQTISGNGVTTVAQIPWTELASPVMSEYRVLITFVSWDINEYTGGTPSYLLYHNTPPGSTMVNGSTILATAVSANGSNEGRLVFRVTIRRISDNSIMYDKYYRFRVESIN